MKVSVFGKKEGGGGGREGRHTVKLTVSNAQWGEKRGERECLLDVVS